MKSHRALIAASTGAIAGTWMAVLLPALAVFRGGQGGDRIALFITLVPAGLMLALLMNRLLQWSCGTRDVPPLKAVLWPWSVSFLPVIAWILPGSYYSQSITTFGGIKYLMAATWLLGVAIYGWFFLKPIIRAADPLRLAAGWAFIALLVSFATASQPPHESDEGDYVAAALAILNDGSTRVVPIVTSGELDRFYFHHSPAPWIDYGNRLMLEPESVNVYSYRMFGYPLLLAPFIAAARTMDEPVVRWWIAYIPGLIGYFLLILALAESLRVRGAAGSIVLTAFATMTPFLYYCSNTQPEIGMAAATAWAIYLIEEYLSGRRGPAGFATVSTLSLLLHERMAALMLPLVLYGFLRGRSRWLLLGACSLCIIPVLFSYAATLQFRLPQHLPHAYGAESTRFVDVARWLEATRQHAFSIRIGLLPHVPPLLLLAGLFLARDGRENSQSEKRAHTAGLFALVVYTALILTYPHTFDSWPHLRYLLPALPLLAPWLREALSRLERKSWGIFLAGSLIFLQWILNWVFLAVPQSWRMLL